VEVSHKYPYKSAAEAATDCSAYLLVTCCHLCWLQGNAKNIPAGNITAAGYMATLHFLQEYATMPKWLPDLYNARNEAVQQQ
jgi:hypothetical protein